MTRTGLQRMVMAMVIMLAVGGFAAGAFAGMYGSGAADGSGSMVDVLAGTPVTVSGTVAEIAGGQSGVKIDTGAVELATVYSFGPTAMWNGAGIAKPQVGEYVVVNGSEVTFSDGSTKIIALSVVIDGVELTLRDAETGAPVWRGIGANTGGAVGAYPGAPVWRGIGGGAGGGGLRDGSCLK